MPIQHKDITEENLHEPKGVSTALADRVYVSDGIGTGAWRKVNVLALDGILTDGGKVRRVVTDGTNKFDLRADAAYGSMSIINNTTPFPIIAATDPTLSDTSQGYNVLTGTGAPWVSDGFLNNFTFDTNMLVPAVSGLYLISFSATLTQYPNSSTRIAIRSLKGGSAYSDRRGQSKATAVTDISDLVCTGFINLTAMQAVQLTIASSSSGNVVVNEANVTLTLIED